ncbi:hypothetical protein PP175_19850 [Aneurinibacillus sp. Ricciae_BoGa-3]|uniref:CBO0543 family protein n=1 Tax=Aneurinibacillus sp. Ricciae_BoGa-3 TaxID=3022697 RepID=UPI0023410CF2|nr:CBO0543 family protein [Aneurinibacillus sp. Ricciae_BoGa-3]WCK53567.1 hypothetical protein PP175_19850 [Aneurinibacillus sp. Ricciae_BoGa-3]
MQDSVRNKIQTIYDSTERMNREYLAIWRDHILFSWEWWVCLLLTIVPWMAWVKFRKKESSDRLLYAGFFVLIISSYLNFLGISYGLWWYLVDVIPTVPSFVVWDCSVLPVMSMLFLQYKPEYSPYIKALLFSLFNSFVAETIFRWIGFYEPKNWNSLYSFPLYYLIYMMADYLSRRNAFVKI